MNTIIEKAKINVNKIFLFAYYAIVRQGYILYYC